jgi:hypothetical protein
VNYFFFDSLKDKKNYIDFGVISEISEKYSILKGSKTNFNIRNRNKKLLWSEFELNNNKVKNFTTNNKKNIKFFSVYNSRKNQVLIKNSLFNFLQSHKSVTLQKQNLEVLNNSLYNYNDFLEINR